MLAALLKREWILAMRDARLRCALMGYLAALVLAALPLYAGVLGLEAASPEARGDVLVSRLRAIQWGLACALTPWLMLRVGQTEYGTSLVRWIALCHCRPWQLALLRWGAGCGLLLLVWVLSLPVVLLACELSPARPAAILGDQLDLFAFLALVGLAVLPTALRRRPSLMALALAYVVLGIVAVGRHAVLGIEDRSLTVAAGVAVAVLALSYLLSSSRQLLYLDGLSG